MCSPTQGVWQPAGCVSCEPVCVCVSLVRVVINLSSVHPYRVGVQSEPGCSSPFYLPTYLGKVSLISPYTQSGWWGKGGQPRTRMSERVFLRVRTVSPRDQLSRFQRRRRYFSDRLSCETVRCLRVEVQRSPTRWPLRRPPRRVELIGAGSLGYGTGPSFG